MLDTIIMMGRRQDKGRHQDNDFVSYKLIVKEKILLTEKCGTYRVPMPPMRVYKVDSWMAFEFGLNYYLLGLMLSHSPSRVARLHREAKVRRCWNVETYARIG